MTTGFQIKRVWCHLKHLRDIPSVSRQSTFECRPDVPIGRILDSDKGRPSDYCRRHRLRQDKPSRFCRAEHPYLLLVSALGGCWVV